MNTFSNIRIFSLFSFFFVLFLIQVSTLFYLQIYQHHFFIDLAHKQYTLKITTTPERGCIYDRHNNYLSSNKQVLSAFISPKNISDPITIKDFLKNHFPQGLQRYEHNPQSSFCYIKRALTSQEEELIINAHIPDIKLLQEKRRIYHLPHALTITGITNNENEGLFGFELLYNKQLTGTPSEYTLERDARSCYFLSTKKESTTGANSQSIYTTLDMHLQRIAQEELSLKAAEYEAQEGALIIMNPDTGEILAAATYPEFDLNNQQDFDIRTTKNNCFTQCYEFGSVCKSFTALAALAEKVVTPDELIDCHNTKLTTFKKRKISTVIPLGVATFEEVIQFSNNIGIAKVADRLQEKLYHYLRLLGFGQPTGLAFPGQQYGFVNPPSSWSAHSIISLSYGYEISATLLQIVRAFCVFANNGHLVTPSIIKQDSYEQGPHIVSAEAIATMRSILEKTARAGTGKYAYIPGYTILGKTGTANLLVNGKYDPDKKIYCYTGSIEKGSYKRVIGAYLKDTHHTKSYASTIVAPLCKTVMEKMVIQEHQITSSF